MISVCDMNIKTFLSIMTYEKLTIWVQLRYWFEIGWNICWIWTGWSRMLLDSNFGNCAWFGYVTLPAFIHFASSLSEVCFSSWFLKNDSNKLRFTYKCVIWVPGWMLGCMCVDPFFVNMITWIRLNRFQWNLVGLFATFLSNVSINN